jgi:hypothetical protein
MVSMVSMVSDTIAAMRRWCRLSPLKGESRHHPMLVTGGLYFDVGQAGAESSVRARAGADFDVRPTRPGRRGCACRGGSADEGSLEAIRASFRREPASEDFETSKCASSFDPKFPRS